VISVVAPAGTGKSRLCFELLERCRAKGLAVLEAQAMADGHSIPLRPLLELFRQRFGISERDSDLAAREKIAGALLLLDTSFAEILPAMFEFVGVPDPARPAPRIDPEAAQRRMLEHFRRVVHADARERTVVTLIEISTGSTTPATASSPSWWRSPRRPTQGGSSRFRAPREDERYSAASPRAAPTTARPSQRKMIQGPRSLSGVPSLTRTSSSATKPLCTAKKDPPT
jgi:AAA ATPase domain